MQRTLENDIPGTLFPGRTTPPSLNTLWGSKNDPELRNIFGCYTLWRDRTELIDGFAEVLLPASEQDPAHGKAYRKIFDQLGFFATVEDGNILAYWFGDPSLEPPIVMLTNEGTFTWQGIHLTEALYRLAEEADDAEAASTWLSQQGLNVDDYGELGSTTQFLPNLDELHQELTRGDADSISPQSTTPTDPSSPLTWLLHPGAEIKQLMTNLFGSPPKHFYVWTTGTGLVSSLMLTKTWPKHLKVLGVGIGDSRVVVESALGQPVQQLPENRFQYRLNNYAFTCAFDNSNNAKEIYLTLASLQGNNEDDN